MPVEGDSVFYAGCHRALQLACILLFRMRAWGAGNVPRCGGVLMASNHQSFLDPVAVGIGVSRQVHYMARRTLFEAPGFGRLIRALKAFPVARGSGDLRAIRGAISILSGGGALLLFPEGTRSPDGSVGEFKPGFALVAARARVPIVPVAVDGTFEAWPRARWLPRAGPVRVAFGEPLAAPAEDKAACIEAAMEVQRRVVALREELRRLA